MTSLNNLSRRDLLKVFVAKDQPAAHP